MSLDKKYELRKIALELSREMRKNPTKAEKIFWEKVRNRQINNIKFRRQQPFIFDYLGKETFYIVDFYSSEKNIVIEIDGKIHNYRKHADEARTEILNMLGLKVIRFNNEEILNNIDEVINKLKVILDSLS